MVSLTLRGVVPRARVVVGCVVCGESNLGCASIGIGGGCLYGGVGGGRRSAVRCRGGSCRGGGGEVPDFA